MRRGGAGSERPARIRPGWRPIGTTASGAGGSDSDGVDQSPSRPPLPLPRRRRPPPSTMSTWKGSTDVHEFDGVFQGSHAFYKVTSVIGHVFSVDFPPAYQNWEGTDPMDLFEAPVLRSECNPKAHVRRHQAQEA